MVMNWDAWPTKEDYRKAMKVLMDGIEDLLRTNPLELRPTPEPQTSHLFYDGQAWWWDGVRMALLRRCGSEGASGEAGD